MTEQLLYDFLAGLASAAELGPALVASRIAPDSWRFRTSDNYRVQPLGRPREISPHHMERFIDALEAGALSTEQVAIACFLLHAGTGRFVWDTDASEGERVADAIFWLGTPEINYPLTPDTLARIRHYLRTGENTFATESSR